MALATPGGAPDAAWKDIAGALGRFCDEHPESLLAGGAAVRRIAVALERLMDPEQAGEAARQATGWADAMAAGGISDSGTLREGLAAWRRPTRLPARRSIEQVMYECYARAGLVAYLRGDADLAAELIRKATRLERSERARIGAETGMERMLSIISGGRAPLTPDELAGNMRNDRQKTALRLADMALATFEPGRAGEHYERLLRGAGNLPRPSPELESYLIFRMGQALKFQDRHDEAMHLVERLYEPRYSRYRWAADGIFQAGRWTYNSTQDPEAAMPHWRHVYTRYPEHPEAEISLFYYGLSAARTEQYRKAADAFSLYLERYPDSRWTGRVRTQLLPESRKHLR